MSAHGTPGDEASAAGKGPVKLRIFVNYRRDDAAGHAGHLVSDLNELGRYDVFIDIEKIDPGLPVKEAIDSALASCDVFLALVGRRWLDATDSGGRVRLENPRDLVRLEIGRALAREGVRVIPVLLQDVEMPAPEALPEPLQELPDRNAHELSDTRWHYDVEQLVQTLDAIAAKKAEQERASEDEAEREAAVAAERERAELDARQQAEREAQEQEQEFARQVQEERERREEGSRPPLSRRTKMLAGGLAAAALVALAALGIAMLFGGGDDEPTTSPPPEVVGNPEATVGVAFPYDATNGTGNSPAFDLTFEEDDLSSGTIPSNAGFTGLMTDGETSLEDLWDPDAVALDDGVLQIRATRGDPLAEPTEERPPQRNAFQFGVSPPEGQFTAHVRLPEPFSDLDSLQNFQSLGLFIGTGDQDNYVKLVAGSQGIELLGEVEQNREFRSRAPQELLGLEGVDLYLTVDPAAATVTASYTVTDGGETGEPVLFEEQGLPALGSWLDDEDHGLAVGVISTTGRAAPEFDARWDLIEVVPGSP